MVKIPKLGGGGGEAGEGGYRLAHGLRLIHCKISHTKRSVGREIKETKKEKEKFDLSEFRHNRL